MIPEAETSNPKTLASDRLISGLKQLVQTERKITSKIVDFINEVDRRKLYLEFGYTSLFGFLVEELGYTPSAAQRRIDTARLSREIPNLQNDIASGDLNLSQVSMLARNLRELHRSDPGTTVSTQAKVDLLETVKKADLVKTELIFSKVLNVPIKTHEKKRVQQDESVRLEITLTRSQMNNLNRVRELISHLHPSPGTAELFSYLADEYLDRKDPLRKVPKEKERKGSDPTTAPVVQTRQSGVEQGVKTRITSSSGPGRVSKPTRRLIFFRDQECQWRDPKTMRKCTSRFRLQIDHKKSKWLGGDDSAENLQVLCSVHNRLKYEIETGKFIVSDRKAAYSPKPAAGFGNVQPWMGVA